jgi:Periplasmic protease
MKFAVAAFLALVTVPAAAFSPAERSAALDSIAGLIEKNYVYKDKAAAIAAEVKSWKNDPAVTAVSDEKRLAALLSERLRVKDRHFVVLFGAGPAASHDATAGDDSERRANYGFVRLERLPGNVAYIRLDYFAEFDVNLTGDKTPPARKVGEAALAFAAASDAVIFDLRHNGGGSPAMVDLLLAGFFGDKPVLLNRFYERQGDRTEDFTTLANFTGARRPDVPLYVLVSGRTGSAAEEFAYDVKTQKRGLLIGETTGGAANPGGMFDAAGGFKVFVSTGAAVNPVTGTNWETVGVAPDVTVPAADALAWAHAEALKRIIATAKPGSDITSVRWAQEQAQAVLKPRTVAAPADYAGTYGDRTVSWRDGSLWYARPRAVPSKLIAIADDAFGLEDNPDIRLAFQRDAKGHIDSVTQSDTDGGARVLVRAQK